MSVWHLRTKGRGKKSNIVYFVVGGFSATVSGIPVLQKSHDSEIVGIHDDKILTVRQAAEKCQT